MKKMQSVRRLAVKVGSSTLTYENGHLNLRRMERLCQVLSDIRGSGIEVILISSGAIAAGMGRMGNIPAERTTPIKQALAAIGQAELMRVYERLFAAWGATPAQILLTKDVLSEPIPRENAENTFETLLSMGVIPIVNENDSVSYEGIKFGGNDTLAAAVAILTKVDLLVNLSDIDGLFDSDPRKNPDAKLIQRVDRIDETILAMAGGAGSARGTGGMAAKLNAAELALSAGIPMLICSGSNPDILYRILDGEQVGTLFAPMDEALG